MEIEFSPITVNIQYILIHTHVHIEEEYNTLLKI